jgi:hypothetical protein
MPLAMTHELRLHGIMPIQPRALIAAPAQAQPRPRPQTEPVPVISRREVLLGVVSNRVWSMYYRASVKRILNHAARLAKYLSRFALDRPWAASDHGPMRAVTLRPPSV